MQANEAKESVGEDGEQFFAGTLTTELRIKKKTQNALQAWHCTQQNGDALIVSMVVQIETPCTHCMCKLGG